MEQKGPVVISAVKQINGVEITKTTFKDSDFSEEQLVTDNTKTVKSPLILTLDGPIELQDLFGDTIEEEKPISITNTGRIELNPNTTSISITPEPLGQITTSTVSWTTPYSFANNITKVENRTVAQALKASDELEDELYQNYSDKLIELNLLRSLLRRGVITTAVFLEEIRNI